jgi:glycerol-3-phosphate dehydrogenase
VDLVLVRFGDVDVGGCGIQEGSHRTKAVLVDNHHLARLDLAHVRRYGAEAPSVEALLAEDPRYAERIHPSLEIRAGEIVWAARPEMARAVEDVLSRRTRALVLDARAALDAAPPAAELLRETLGKSEEWRQAQIRDFDRVARNYLPPAAV